MSVGYGGESCHSPRVRRSFASKARVDAQLRTVPSTQMTPRDGKRAAAFLKFWALSPATRRDVCRQDHGSY
jgi:hypothetical protein